MTAWISAVAAALLIGIGLGRMQRQPAEPVATAALEPASQTSLVSYEEAEYEAAVEDLQAILHALRAELQPETIEAVEGNLRIIDLAIADARAALAADPANEHLHRYLVERMQKKIRMLRAVTGLVTAQI